MGNDISILTPESSNYPALLREIYDPPARLFLRGSIDLGDRLIVTVVGSRKATAYGIAAVKLIVEPLAAAGAVIVSGLAYGIDAAAHEAALAVGGMTIAVLGTPITKIYPAVHSGLADKILAGGGAILSEVAPGGISHRGSFPLRNRIVAGMSHATIIVEAIERSGSLITARLAMQENRDVFAVPGPITAPSSRGTNRLIQEGAIPVLEAADVFAAYRLNPLKTEETKVDLEVPFLQFLSATEPIHIDNLQKSVTIDLPQLQSELTLLELRGLVRMVGPGMYIRI